MNQMMMSSLAATLFVAGLLTACFLLLGTLGTMMFTGSATGQTLLRRYLARRLTGTRMVRMLEARDVWPLRYVLTVPTDEIRANLKVCENCSRQDECDDTLNYAGPRQKSYAYCPNRGVIDRLQMH